MKRLIACCTFGFLVAITVGSVFALFMAGSFLDTPSRSIEKSDLIVSLGGDVGERVLKAADLYKLSFAPFVLLTGVEGGHTRTCPDYLNWRARFLIGHGVPESAVLFDFASASSWEEAVNTLHLMQSRKMKRALVVSDPPHLRRLDWVWGKVFAGSGMEYRLVAAPMEGWDATHWWRNEQSAQFVLMEYIKFGYYLVVH